MNIPFTRAIITENRAQIDADDGHQIIATLYRDGTWHLLNEFSAKPTKPYHFDLRSQFVNALAGVKQ